MQHLSVISSGNIVFFFFFSFIFWVGGWVGGVGWGNWGGGLGDYMHVYEVTLQLSDTHVCLN